MNGIHVFVFCCAEYKSLVKYCIESIQNSVLDNILSINIVSNLKIDIDDANLILDRDFWKTLDPDWNYRELYNANWTKQQIFKLNVDKFVNGNVLIVDAEILFLKPTQWVENNKTNYYTSFSEEFKPYFDLNKELIGLEKLHPHSFITDSMIFSTKVLQSLRNEIELKHGRPWLDVLNTLIIDSSNFTLSEFELYGNYILKNYPDTVNNILGPIQHVIVQNNRQEYSISNLIDHVKQQTNNNFISVNINAHSHNSRLTSWLSFYDQIRDPSWPDCDYETDFSKLPLVIQQECINIFGYIPTTNT
jgi:hypothetical protein